VCETKTCGRDTEKVDDKKGESQDAGKDDSKEKPPVVEVEKVSYIVYNNNNLRLFDCRHTAQSNTHY